MKKSILVVDDDRAIRSSLTLLLEHEGYAVTTASDRAEAIAAVRAHEPSLVFLDMNFGRATTGEEGLTLLSQIKLFRPDTPVVLMTAWGSIPLAVEGMKRGAADFVAKPWNNFALLEMVAALTDGKSGAVANDVFDRSLIVGESKEISRVLEVVRRVASSDASVLIMGENGTGKELVAETIHRNSPRATAPFVKVNLGGISQSLFESEMFGHRKGAFTDAVADRKGRFELADKGTIFLDEIGELTPACQVKLLRVLQEHTFEPLGSSRTIRADVRVVSATNARLPQMVAHGTFREDLFYRLNLITVVLPPLRERTDDIELLVKHFASDRAEFSSKAIDLLRSMPFPGNIRELKNLVERAILMCGSTVDDSGLRKCLNFAPDMALTGTESTTLSSNEKSLIQEALAECHGNITAAAQRLGLTRQALYRRIEKYGIIL
ncbi:MAG: sigma-54 dependent transcriptional regulator [Muribaculaceae bacterium]|nr:sigma-54 dependent transcriptional regulator [Muribaculaceae bacterium]